MRKLFLSFAFLLIGYLAFAQESAAPPKDFGGFSGYAWGTDIEFISSDMERENYELISASCTNLSYHGKLLEERVTLIYAFENEILVSGIWIFDDVDYDTFWRVNQFLQDTYKVKTELTLKGNDWIEAEMFPQGTNAHIVHNLDVADDRHEVHYYFRSGEE
jgi:hypothetical protein